MEKRSPQRSNWSEHREKEIRRLQPLFRQLKQLCEQRGKKHNFDEVIEE